MRPYNRDVSAEALPAILQEALTLSDYRAAGKRLIERARQLDLAWMTAALAWAKSYGKTMSKRRGWLALV